MKTKRVTVIIVAILFVLVMLVSCVALFSVKKIDVNYSVGNDTDTVEVQNKLEGFLGKNLIFLNEDEVVESIKDFHYMEVLSVKKSFPNVVRVDIKERREVYEIVCGETVYVTTENGLLLRSFNVNEQKPTRDRIRLELKDINVYRATLGQLLITDADELLWQVFKMSKSVQLTNCIENVVLEKATVFGGKATFVTYTGVKIIIRELLERGVEKIQTAFEKYDGATDYEKTFKQIEVVILTQTGEIIVLWTNEGSSAE